MTGDLQVMKQFRKISFILCLIPAPLLAKEANPADDGWGGSAELGLITTRGNTETSSSNARLTINYQTAPWTHQLNIELLRAEDSGVKTADRSEARYRAKYQFSARGYYFGSLRYEDDPFAGYDQRTTEVIGYGRNLSEGKIFNMDLELGVGGRQTEFTDNRDVDETIYRIATNLKWQISETSSLIEELSVESGDENTVTESTTELKVKINSSLAMKATLKIKDNSDVPVGTKNTDTTTSVTLVYDF
jgi:putative salt-induced outer membrane protein